MPILLRLRFPKQLVFCAIEYLVPLGPALPRDVLFFSSPAASLIKPYLFAQDPTSGSFLTRKRGPRKPMRAGMGSLSRGTCRFHWDSFHK